MMTPSASLDGVLKRSRGVVVAEVKWMGVEPMILSAGSQRPSLVLASVLEKIAALDLSRLQHFAFLTRTLVMPELAHRWARSTLRLRELTATQLGAIEQMEVVCRLPAETPFPRLMAIDWCCNVMQSEARSVESSTNGEQLVIRFRRMNREGRPVSVRLTIEDGPLTKFPICGSEVTCRHGRIHITGEETLEWQTGRGVEKESLTSDRSAEDVMIDLFGRRLAGGLVPVPDIGDVVRAQALLQAAEESARLGQEIELRPGASSSSHGDQ
ncbi:hypothetical protein [Planctomicrobium sp. SH664]|uniref:hypothetical protein n=1 Tax=Planctomicrobium sp. SH664 TaxID=3448125 RepID=UPI003F5B8A41